MPISIFLSHPVPHQLEQQRFVAQAEQYLIAQGLEPRTLGKSNYDMDAPLAGIRRLMIGCCGLLTIALKRSHAPTVEVRRDADVSGFRSETVTDVWLTSPYSQIEPAMAYQFGIPILIMKERGVLAEGVLERGVTGLYLPEFDCSQNVFGRDELTAVVQQWIGRVRNVYDTRGHAPLHY